MNYKNDKDYDDIEYNKNNTYEKHDWNYNSAQDRGKEGRERVDNMYGRWVMWKFETILAALEIPITLKQELIST